MNVYRYRCSVCKRPWVQTTDDTCACVYCGAAGQTPTGIVARYVEDSTGCWIWQGRTNNLGYGVVSIDGRETYAHRWTYAQRSGPIPKGADIDHLCRRPPCVNPAHLEAVTHAENLRRGAGTKLTVEQVKEIRRRRNAGETCNALGLEFGVHGAHVSKITRGKKWPDRDVLIGGRTA